MGADDMPTDPIEAAAAQLWQLWQSGRRIERLEPALTPRSPAEGYRIQAALARLSGQPVIGWKVAATSSAGQAHIAVDGPIAGRLLADKICRHPAELALGDGGMRVAEAEFAFRLGVDLPPRAQAYTLAEVMQGVVALYPAIELPDSRFEDFTAVGGAQLAADNACADRFVLGPEADADWRQMDLSAQAVELSVNDRVVTRGRGGDALGDPRAALLWLVNWASAAGESLLAGQLITTGVCGRPSPLRPGDRVTADFGALGSVRVDLSAAAS